MGSPWVEAQIDLEGDNAAAADRVTDYGASDDHLATTRLPRSIAGQPPLPPARVPSVAPPARVASPQPLRRSRRTVSLR